MIQKGWQQSLEQEKGSSKMSLGQVFYKQQHDYEKNIYINVFFEKPDAV